MEVLAVFGLVMALWLSQTWHGVNTGIVALAGAVALFVLGRIEPETSDGSPGRPCVLSEAV